MEKLAFVFVMALGAVDATDPINQGYPIKERYRRAIESFSMFHIPDVPPMDQVPHPYRSKSGDVCMSDATAQEFWNRSAFLHVYGPQAQLILKTSLLAVMEEADARVDACKLDCQMKEIEVDAKQGPSSWMWAAGGGIMGFTLAMIIAAFAVP